VTTRADDLTERVFRLRDTIRLTPSVWDEPILDDACSGKPALLAAADELGDATDPRIAAERGINSRLGLPAGFLLPINDRLNSHIVNGAFTHSSVTSRFSSRNRGAWYASDDLNGARAEVEYHRAQIFGEMDPAETSAHFPLTLGYSAWASDITASLHVLEATHHDVLDPDSVVASRALAAELISLGSLGVHYPSVRAEGHSNIACFQPSIVQNVRLHDRFLVEWNAPSAQPIWASTAA
jgi:hypothetical protein